MLVKGIQGYIGGDDIKEEEEMDEDNEGINEEDLQMELMPDDFDAA